MEISEVEKRFEFHDLPLRSMELNFNESYLALKVDAFDEAKQDYVPYTLRFSAISDFELNGGAGIIDYDGEIYEMEYTRQDSGNTAYKFILQCRGASFRLSFVAKDLQLEQPHP